MKTNHLRILYVVWWEGTTDSALIRNQVVSLLKALRKNSPDATITLLMAGGWARAWLRDTLLRIPLLCHLIKGRLPTRVDIPKLEAELRSNDIDLICRETIFAPKNVYLHFPLSWLLPFGHRRYLERLVNSRGIDLVHCRSYSAAWALHSAKRKFGLFFKLVFDTRGLIPEEGIVQGLFSEDSLSYRAWKRIEKRLLDSADAIVNVSDTFTEHVSGLTSNRNIYTIPTIANTSVFLKAEPKRGSLAEFGSRKVLVYLGALDPGGWHSPENLAKIYLRFREVFSETKLMVIAPASGEVVKRQLGERGVPPADVFVTATRDPSETAECLSLAHYGVLPFRRASSSQEKLIGYTMIASKTGEYLAAGLPIICHEAIGGAGRMIRDYRLGCVFSESDVGDSLRRELLAIDADYLKVSCDCRERSKMFDVEFNAREYIRVYNSLLSDANA